MVTLSRCDWGPNLNFGLNFLGYRPGVIGLEALVALMGTRLCPFYGAVGLRPGMIWR